MLSVDSPSASSVLALVAEILRGDFCVYIEITVIAGGMVLVCEVSLRQRHSCAAAFETCCRLAFFPASSTLPFWDTPADAGLMLWPCTLALFAP
jgi:hypothetical protein